MPRSEASIESLAETFEKRFRASLGGLRRVGREAEFPVVDGQGRAADLRELWKSLQQEPGFTAEYDVPDRRDLLVGLRSPELVIAAEVGRSTIELSVGPYANLNQLQAGLRRGLDLVQRHAHPLGFHLLGYGIQPSTPASLSLMTPRRHYQAFQRVLGRAWLPLTSTASDQLHVDIARHEIIPAVNALNLLSGPLIALCANSSVYAGRVGVYLSGREGRLRSLGETRYGMTPRRLDDVGGLIEYLCDFPCYLLPRSGGFDSIGRTFRAWLRGPGARQTPEEHFQAFLWHDHYVWNSARARVAHSTLEVRSACQQPPGELMAANALILGWVESMEEVLDYFERTLGDKAWRLMRRFRREAVRRGLHAVPPVPGMLEWLVAFSTTGLIRRGQHEEEWITPIDRRLEEKVNPADRARHVYRSAGVPGLVAERALTADRLAAREL